MVTFECRVVVGFGFDDAGSRRACDARPDGGTAGQSARHASLVIVSLYSILTGIVLIDQRDAPPLESATSHTRTLPTGATSPPSRQ